MNLRARLRSETAALHAHLETLPFFTALRSGTLPSPAIVTPLRSLAIVHAVLERSLSEAPDAELTALSASVPRKLPLEAALRGVGTGQC